MTTSSLCTFPHWHSVLFPAAAGFAVVFKLLGPLQVPKGKLCLLPTARFSLLAFQCSRDSAVIWHLAHSLSGPSGGPEILVVAGP